MRTLSELPSPHGIPFLGNIHQLDIQTLHKQIEAWETELGSVFTFSIGPKQVYVTSDPDLAQIALRERPEAFRKLSSMTSVIDEMGFNGVFSAEGEAWQPQRRLVMQALAKKGFSSFFPTLKIITERLFNRWHDIASRDETTDIVQDLVKFTVDVTSTLSFGQDINTLEYDGDPIQTHLSTIFPMVTLRANLPFAYWRYIKLPQDYKLEKSIRIVKDFVWEMIEAARQEVDKNPLGPSKNLLQAMVRAAHEPGSGITDEMVYANVVTLLLAGEDTTAHTLAWTTYCLAQRPMLQRNLQRHARKVLGDLAMPAEYSATEHLSLFEATAFEAMRFKPTVPLIFLETNDEVQLGNTRLPARTPVFLALRSAMTSEQHFSNAARFEPERWQTNRHVLGQTHNKRAFMQFGAGPRVCPGRHLAILEIRMVLSMLARNFSIEFSQNPEDIEEAFAFTMLPRSLPLALRCLP